MLPITQVALQDFPQLLNQEWLESNAQGSYASSNVLDCPSRRYHGLLVSDAGYLPEKHVFLAKLEASLSLRGRTIDLYTNKHADTVFYPEGYTHIESFSYDLYSQTVYRIGSILIERAQILLHDRDAVIVRYRLLSPDPVQMTLRPLLAYRNHHSLRHETSDFQVKTFSEPQGHKIEPLPHKPALHMGTNRVIGFYPGPFWVKQLEYSREQARGFDYQEDLFCPGLYETALEPDQNLFFIFGFTPTERQDIADLWDGELHRRRTLKTSFARDQEPLCDIKYEAEKFLIQRPDGSPSIVAGYPWFGEWGRDTMIALPGLTLGRGQAERFLPIVKSYLHQAKDGLIPNYLAQGTHPPSYNSVDAVLWMFDALQQYWIETRDKEGLSPILPALFNLVDDLLQGRQLHVRIDAQGLMLAGSPHTQLTWMDAAVDGNPVTPRSGYPVEVNALWISALIFLQEMTSVCGMPPHDALFTLLEHAPAAFRQKFWLEDRGYLADTVSAQGEVNASIRPNQILAVSLPFSPLSLAQQRRLMDVVNSHLLTPYGLRTLSPQDPAFVPFYLGGPRERDAAYHQGTVWPWLLGPYAKALLKVSPNKTQAKQFLRTNVQALWQKHLTDGGLMGISEIFDGMYPYHSDGCIFQAWSVASVIELMNMLKTDDLEWTHPHSVANS